MSLVVVHADNRVSRIDILLAPDDVKHSTKLATHMLLLFLRQELTGLGIQSRSSDPDAAPTTPQEFLDPLERMPTTPSNAC